MPSEDEQRWAEAMEIERLHGDDGPRWIAERIGALALAGDEDGVERFRRIALCYAGLLGSVHRPQ